MKLRVVGLWVLGVALSFSCFGQRIVDQTSIDTEGAVYLFEPISLSAFTPALSVGENFPDFETISTTNEVISLDILFQESIENESVPVVVFGRPSCNFMRAAYEHMIIPIRNAIGSDISIYHIAPSIEAHPTNGYISPYYTINQGDTISGNVEIPDNIGFEFFQPYSGQNLISYTAGFIDKMVETQVGNEQDFENINILLDDLSGGFTQAFSGPAIVWVLNPFSGEVVFERTDFGCYYDQVNGCQPQRQELLSAIQEVKDQYQLVGIESQENSDVWVKITGVNLLGQNVENGAELFYNPITKVKQIRPAQ